MRRGIRKYLANFLAVLGLVVVGTGIGVYILHEQRLRFPLVEEQPFRLQVELSDAQAVAPGQGQSVRVAGVTVGAIGDVRLEDGHAVVNLELDRRHDDLVREDATALLRSKTGLKDMFVEIDPGHGRPMDEGDRIGMSGTLPDVDLDEVVAALDSDTRAYLRLLISGAGEGLRGRGRDAGAALRRLGPLQRDVARVSGALAERRRALRRLVNRYGLLTEELGRSDREIVRVVRAGNSVFEALASERDGLSASTARLPGTLSQTRRALGDVEALSVRLDPALRALRPTVAELEPAARALVPLAREGTPIVRKRLRPLVRAVPPELARLSAASRDLSRAGPDLTTSLGQVNRLLNMVAYNPGGAESLDGLSFPEQRNRQEGYLYWAAWTAQAGQSLLGNGDGQGVFRRFTFGNTNCAVFGATGLPPTAVDVLGTAGLCSK